MSMNQTPAAERLHIGIFGRRNAGKSSVINAVTGQDLAIVSDVKGTTTDPVFKAMELLPLGPVMLIDTPGLDDEGELGKLRIRKSYDILNKTDVALLVVDAQEGKTPEDTAILTRIRKKSIPYLVVYNKADLCSVQVHENEIAVSAQTGEGIHALKERIASIVPKGETDARIVGDLLQQGDFVVLVIPIDASAPKGRLILPQQQTIRDILDTGAVAVVSKDTELQQTLASIGKPPKLVITDSQAFGKVSRLTPPDILLTSFSILFARYKGNLEQLVRGAAMLDRLQEGNAVLIAEGCTHHRQCEDIGTVKLPRWIQEYTKKELDFHFTSGTEFPEDLSPYQLVIHCGGCMLNEREIKYRLQCAADRGIPVTNYGIAIAYLNGILQRSVEPFTDISGIFQDL